MNQKRTPEQVNAHNSCQDLTGETQELCLAVGYSQTAMSVVCGGEYTDSDHCGTFLELHMHFDNSYVNTEEVLSEVRLQTENVSVIIIMRVFCLVSLVDLSFFLACVQANVLSV